MRDKEIVETVRSFYPDVQAVYVFGSYGTEYDRGDSDADIALLLPVESAKRETRLGFSDCCRALERRLGRSVDLVNLRSVDTVFKHEIVQTGAAIHVGDDYETGLFETITMSLYQKVNEERAEILRDVLVTGKVLDI
ncbi:nucleotidyltransferase domain-containing protein [Candidatus Sumerlaeota bacterium]|nr:nucleotidyltransferase domain-containing protein [Candidatus Sumerlaeota bacterium]